MAPAAAPRLLSRLFSTLGLGGHSGYARGSHARASAATAVAVGAGASSAAAAQWANTAERSAGPHAPSQQDSASHISTVPDLGYPRGLEARFLWGRELGTGGNGERAPDASWWAGGAGGGWVGRGSCAWICGRPLRPATRRGTCGPVEDEGRGATWQPGNRATLACTRSAVLLPPGPSRQQPATRTAPYLLHPSPSLPSTTTPPSACLRSAAPLRPRPPGHAHPTSDSLGARGGGPRHGRRVCVQERAQGATCRRL